MDFLSFCRRWTDDGCSSWESACRSSWPRASWPACCPTLYRSTATYSIEEARLAGIGGGGSQRESFADQYVKDLTERVLSTESVRQMLTATKQLPLELEDQAKAIAEKKKQIRVKVLSEQVLDPQSGRERTIISAFDIGNDETSPEKARDGTAWLADAFIVEDRKTRHERARGYTSFLVSEGERRKAQVDAIEGRLADFKQKNIGQLPELAAMNLETRDRAERDLSDSESQLRTLMRERSFVQQQMNQFKGGPATARLQDLEDTYRDRLHTYDANHPDMLSLQREIQSLKEGQGGRTGGGTLREQLAAQKDMLTQARQRYSEEHPDIARMKRQVAALEQRIASGESADKDTSPISATELQLRTQLNSLNEQIASLQSRTGETRTKISTISASIRSSPQVEREYQLLNQDLLGRPRQLPGHPAEAHRRRRGRSGHRLRLGRLLPPDAAPEPAREEREVLGHRHRRGRHRVRPDARLRHRASSPRCSTAPCAAAATSAACSAWCRSASSPRSPIPPRSALVGRAG